MPNDLNTATDLRAMVHAMGESARVASHALARATTAAKNRALEAAAGALVDRAYIMFEGKVQVAGPVRDLVYDDRVAQMYLGPTLTARLRARLDRVA